MHAADDTIDLNPLIDVITILLVFFMIGGHVRSVECEQITVPPGQTGGPISGDWPMATVNVASTDGRPSIKVGSRLFAFDTQSGKDDFRDLLDRVYDRSEKFRDRSSDLNLPKFTLELRVDVEIPFRTIQDIEKLACDCERNRSSAERKPFNRIEYAVHDIAPDRLR